MEEWGKKETKMMVRFRQSLDCSMRDGIALLLYTPHHLVSVWHRICAQKVFVE